MRTLLRSLIGGLAVVAALAGSSRATIYYWQAAGSGAEVWQVNDDGTGRTRVFNASAFPDLGGDAFAPRPSNQTHGGSRLWLYVNGSNASHYQSGNLTIVPGDVCYYTADGQGNAVEHRVTAFAGTNSTLVFDHYRGITQWARDDGFVSVRGWDLARTKKVLIRIAVSAADMIDPNFVPIAPGDSRVQVVVDTTSAPYDPSIYPDLLAFHTWSPDGTTLAYNHRQEVVGGTYEMHGRVVGAPGTPLASPDPTLDPIITTAHNGSAFDWSPRAGSNDIAFTASGAAYTVNAQTGALAQLFRASLNNSGWAVPLWEPSGSSLVMRESSSKGPIYVSKFLLGLKAAVRLTPDSNGSLDKYPLGWR